MLIRCLCKKAYHIYPLCKTGINVTSLSLRPHPDRHASSCGLLVFWNFFRRTERIHVMPRLSSLWWFESSEPPQSGNLSQWYLNAWLSNSAVFSLWSTLRKFESLSSCFITLSTSYIFYPTWCILKFHVFSFSLNIWHNVIIFCTFDFIDGFVINSEFIASSFKIAKDLLANINCPMKLLQ